MAPKITMQNIADATGYSRNTVSKSLNGNVTVPESTRSIILSKAANMGYKQFSGLLSSNIEKSGGTVALFTNSMPSPNHFGSRFISSFTEEISRLGYTLTIYILQGSDVKELCLPANFSKKENVGILCIELFSREYSQFICSLGLPVLFADSYVNSGFDSLACDLVMMENRYSTEKITTHMVKEGAKTIGFLGDRLHCQSFSERYEGFCSALNTSLIRYDEKICILANDSNFYGSSTWLYGQLLRIQKLPDAFVCANDYIAISLVKALKLMGVTAPKNILIAGFDDSPEAKILEPRLTTVTIPGGDMGVVGAQTMLSRIDNPRLPFRSTYVQTTLKIRESSTCK